MEQQVTYTWPDLLHEIKFFLRQSSAVKDSLSDLEQAVKGKSVGLTKPTANALANRLVENEIKISTNGEIIIDKPIEEGQLNNSKLGSLGQKRNSTPHPRWKYSANANNDTELAVRFEQLTTDLKDTTNSLTETERRCKDLEHENLQLKNTEAEYNKLKPQFDEMKEMEFKAEICMTSDEVSDKSFRGMTSINNSEIGMTSDEISGHSLRGMTPLSAMAGAKLTDNNPHITDLSDGNCPTKLAEKYTELYDNEWTEAFAFLTDVCSKTEEESITMLLDALKETYMICERHTTSKTSAIMTAISNFQQSETPSSEVMKLLKDDRKQHSKLHLEKFKKSMRGELKALRADVQSKDKERKQFKHYISKCTDLCFLMTIQDPPVVLDCQDVMDGQPFDKDIYRDYTVRGKKIKFIVWPALYLHSGGPVLAKGVAQCHKRNRKPSASKYQSQRSITTYPVEFNVENGERGHMVDTASRRSIYIGINNCENISNYLPGDVTRITPSNLLLVRPDDKTNHNDTTDTPTDQREESAASINEEKQNSIMVQRSNNIPPVNHKITHV